jgi:hypothetical protein
MKKLIILMTILSIVTSSYGQEFSFPLYFEDSLGYKDTLIFGYDANATDSIDAVFDEINIKTLPFETVFEARICDYFSSNNGQYIPDPTTYHLKKQIKKKDCISSDWPFASGIILSNVTFPLKVYWDSSLFFDPCKQNSLITDWEPGGWFDAVYGGEQGPYYLKSHDTVSFAYTTHHFITPSNDTLSVLFITLANVYNFLSGTHEIQDPNSINIFPVPTTDHLTIQLLDPKLKIRTIQLFDIVGKGQYLSFTDATVELGSIQNGLYFIRLTFENGQSVTKKIIKN